MADDRAEGASFSLSAADITGIEEGLQSVGFVIGEGCHEETDDVLGAAFAKRATLTEEIQ